MYRFMKKFPARGEDGREVVIQVLAKFVPAPTRGDPHAVVPTTIKLQTAEGLSVNQNSATEFEIVQTCERLISDSPVDLDHD